jgi:hypothetical protein
VLATLTSLINDAASYVYKKQRTSDHAWSGQNSKNLTERWIDSRMSSKKEWRAMF